MKWVRDSNGGRIVSWGWHGVDRVKRDVLWKGFDERGDGS